MLESRTSGTAALNLVRSLFLPNIDVEVLETAQTLPPAIGQTS